MQLTLLNEALESKKAQPKVERIGARLEIPEAIRTIDFTHGLHRFPGKFVPQIPQYIFTNYLHEKSRILDPFCGSGTTLVEAILANRSCVGYDIDPLSILVVNAKTHPLSTSGLLEVSKRLNEVVWKRACADLMPTVPNLSHWFSDEVITQLSALKKACLELGGAERVFALVLFSSIIRRVSNADDQTQKTYVSHTYKKTPPLPRQLFPVILRRGLERMADFSKVTTNPPRCEVRLHDSRASFADTVFDDVVTSPPYIDSIDYVYNQMLEYYWLLPELGLDSHEDYKALRKRPMGMVKSTVELPASIAKKIPQLQLICDTIESESAKEAQAVKTFFSDYAKHVAEISKVQKKNGIYATVVASSLIRGQVVPTPDALVAIHESFGYELRDRFVYGIKRHYMKFPRRQNSSKIIEDNVLLFTLRP